MVLDSVTVRVRKLLRNQLLKRRQFVVEVSHPGSPPPSKAEIAEEIQSFLNAANVKNIALFGFRTVFGGGKSTGFGLCYDSTEAMEEFEPRHRLIKKGLAEERKRKRKQWKDLKKKIRSTWGTGKRAAKHKQKRAANA